MTIARWQKWGLYAGFASFLMNSCLVLFPDLEFWLEGTIWQLILMVVHYPAYWATQVLFPSFGVRELYDVPVPWQTTFRETIQWIVVAFAWWFLLGALGSVLFVRLRRRRVHADDEKLS